MLYLKWLHAALVVSEISSFIIVPIYWMYVAEEFGWCRFLISQFGKRNARLLTLLYFTVSLYTLTYSFVVPVWHMRPQQASTRLVYPAGLIFLLFPEKYQLPSTLLTSSSALQVFVLPSSLWNPKSSTVCTGRSKHCRFCQISIMIVSNSSFAVQVLSTHPKKLRA